MVTKQKIASLSAVSSTLPQLSGLRYGTPPEVVPVKDGAVTSDSQLAAQELQPEMVYGMSKQDFEDWVDASKWNAQIEISALVVRQRKKHIESVDFPKVARDLFEQNKDSIVIGGKDRFFTPEEYVKDATEQLIYGIMLYTIQQEGFREIKTLVGGYKSDLFLDPKTREAAAALAEKYNMFLMHYYTWSISFMFDYEKALTPHLEPLVRQRVFG